jgi:hypothetical protein
MAVATLRCYEEPLAHLVRRLQLCRPIRPFTRCTARNTPVESVGRETIAIVRPEGGPPTGAGGMGRPAAGMASVGAPSGAIGQSLARG